MHRRAAVLSISPPPKQRLGCRYNSRRPPEAAASGGKIMFAVFNRPSANPPDSDGNFTDSSIENFILDAFRSAKRGSTVFGGVMNWKGKTFTDRLDGIRRDRDLRLRLVTGHEDGAISKTVREFFRSITDGVAAAVNPDGMVAHTKFFVFESIHFADLGRRQPGTAFSSLPGRGPAICMGSFNIGEGLKHNACVLVPINGAVRRRCRAYFNDLIGEYKELVGPAWRRWLLKTIDLILHGPSSNRFRFVDAPHCRVYFYPRTRGAHRDTIVNALNNIRHANEKVADASCRIRLVFARWQDTRIEVARTLKAIKVMNPDTVTIEVIARATTGGGSDGPDLDVEVAEILDTCATRFVERTQDKLFIHSKYLLVDAPYQDDAGGYTRQQLVWTGSPNLTGNAIDKRWEMLIKLNDSGAFAAFNGDFDWLAQFAATRVTANP